jgi:annexin A7/11
MSRMAISVPRMEGTVKPIPNFNAESDAQVLRKAMKGMGTDEKAIIDVLGYRSNAQRQEILKLYKTAYGKDLIKDLKSELGGKFEDVVLALMLRPEEFEAGECKRAIAGLGTDEDALIEILCTRTNAQIHAIRAEYKRLYKRDLEKDLMGDTSGDFRRLMVSMCNGNRQEQEPVTMEKAQREAKILYESGEARFGTDESEFNRILCLQSHGQLAVTFAEYTKMSKKSMEQVIRSEFSGSVEQGMLTIVKCAQNSPAYFAEKLYNSMKGLGTSDRDLIRVVVTRSEVDMWQIKSEFRQRYKQSLEQFIKDDCSGDYKKMLLALVS